MMSASVRCAATTLLALAALLAPSATAGAAAPPQPLELAKGWRFATAPAGPWKGVTVPHVFDGTANERLFDGTAAWYELKFQGPRTNEGWGWELRFDGVRRRAEVFLNGRSLGRNADPYTPFSLPAKGMIPGRENTLRVRVDNRRTPGVREGWWNWGGITRGVRLEPRGRVALRDTAVLGDVSCSGVCRASMLVDGWITNHSDKPVRPDVAADVKAPGGGASTQRTVRLRTIRPGERARVQFRVPVPGAPKLWAPERPALYEASVQARLGDVVQSVESQHVGLRSVRARDGHLWLNGKRLELRGASIQEDMPGRGPALTDADIERIVDDLKALHANVTRAHYLLDERLLDRLDEEGILVWSQAPVYHRDVQLRTLAGRERELATVRRTVVEARRHPSVLTHSVANELSPQPDKTAATRDFLMRAKQTVEELDPTVPASVDILAWPGFPRQKTYAKFKLLGLNSYFGWYKGDPQHETGDLNDLEPFLDRAHKQYFDQALVMTEFGAEATMDGPTNVKESYDFQARYLRSYLDIIEEREFLSGAIYWTLREFAVKPDWDGGAQRTDISDAQRDGIHNKGLLRYADGTPKPAWDIATSDFEATPMYRTASPRAVAAALDEAPPEAKPSAGQYAVAAAILAALVAMALLLLRAARSVWRHGGAPAPPLFAEEPEPGERRLRAVA
jgi:beta-galactosidase/beta-glucuronidase